MFPNVLLELFYQLINVLIYFAAGSVEGQYWERILTAHSITQSSVADQNMNIFCLNILILSTLQIKIRILSVKYKY